MNPQELKECCLQFSLLSLRWNPETGFFLSVEALLSDKCSKIKDFLYHCWEAP
jgi:hypothetical protein